MKLATLVTLVTINVVGLGSVNAQDLATPQRRIPYADLNLSTVAGQAALYRRVHVAAVEVCGGFETAPDKVLSWEVFVDACTREALSRAVSDINVSAFTAYVSGKGVSNQPIRYAEK